MRAPADRSQLVVTGSSAGGIEALTRVLSALPADFPAPVVVAQHLDPRVPSNLASILGRRTALNVVAVTQSTPLEAGTVYVVPANRHVEITDHTVSIYVGESHDRPKPSIDLLFLTAAEIFGDRLIAVVLSGLGSDGTDGARSVKQRGGMVIIEDPMTAAFPSMPASLEAATVDLIVPAERIGSELVRLVNASIEMPDDVPAMRDLLERIKAASGIDFSHYKPATIRRRLAQQISAVGCRTIPDYLTYLDAKPDELQRLVSTFLIKVTEFFRDAELFEALRKTIVPDLIAYAQNLGGRELRLWSAGCATGEEAYSLAMVVCEALRDIADPIKVRIFATDIDESAISFARRGLYPHDSIAQLEPYLLETYFTAVDDGWEVNKSIRSMTVFGQHDLGQRAPFPRMDLAVCRNVMIYFSKDLQLRTLQIFAFSLRNGGYLILGKAETSNPLEQFFRAVDPALRIFRRHGERVMIPPAPVHRPFAGTREAERPVRPFPAFEPASRDARITTNEKLGAFLTNSSIGVILVDRRYDILAINATAREMFTIHGVAIGEDLVHLMVADSAQAIRTLLDAALRNQQPTVGGEEIAITGNHGDLIRYLTISCYPEIAEGKGGISGAVILAVDVTELALARRTSEQTIVKQSTELQQLLGAQQLTRDRQRSLIEANRQLAMVNSELRAQNDALVINAEEAAAATEEVETLNEEMQATNEELETLNEEFQATIEELNTTNAEHAARATDLEEQTRNVTAEKRAADAMAAALCAIVDDRASAVAVVDAQGTVLASNAGFRAIRDGSTESSVQIADDTGATISLPVVLRRAGQGDTFGFRYRAISANQSLSMYDGRVRPLANGTTPACGIVELTPAP